MTIAVATAATPLAGAASASDSTRHSGAAAADRANSRDWSPFFSAVRPVPAGDVRRVIVTFEDPSLGAWEAAGEATLTPAQRKVWLKRALVLQQRRIDALGAAGVQFRIEHRYIRVLNGVSIVVHGDGTQLLRAVKGVEQVTSVRTLWPAIAGAASSPDPTSQRTSNATGQGSEQGAGIRIGVLDTGIDASHPAVVGRVVAGFDATAPEGTQPAPVTAEAHGTAVAGIALHAAGATSQARIVPIRVLASNPTKDGAEAVLGTSDDLLAGLEYAVDPNADGDTSDRLDVALVASTSPFAGFAGAPEASAVRAADSLGTVVVAAAGNDGASGDEVGTVGAIAAAEASLSVGAADLRGRTPAADVRIRGGGIDDTFEGAPVLSARESARLPQGRIPVVGIDRGGSEVTDYLDSELRSKVTGKVALIGVRDKVTIHEQIRAAADAGAIAVLIAARGAGAAAGTIDVEGADIPAIAITRKNARSINAILDGGATLTVDMTALDERNPAFGTVAGLSSGGPSLDGVARPDVVAPGVGMLVAGDRAKGETWRTVSGTSIAAAWAAGEVAALRSERPDWDATTVRAALLGTAIPLGDVGERPPVSIQGAGVLDADRAAAVTWLSGTGRIDFGAVAPGSEARRALAIRPVLAALGLEESDAHPRVLLDDGGHSQSISPSLADGEVVLTVPADANTGQVGGWLVLPEHELRIPWSATIRDSALTKVALDAQLSTSLIDQIAGPGAFASTLTLRVGGSTGFHGSALGLGAVQRLEIRAVDAKGKDQGVLGSLEQALPGVYTFGITGLNSAGDRLKPGAWQLRLRYIPAADPQGEWRTGPVLPLTVLK